MSDTQNFLDKLNCLISTHITTETKSLKKKLMEVENDRDLLEKQLLSMIGTYGLEKLRQRQIKNSSRKLDE